ncbi:hypothetical protein Cadr_000027719 [Camelus dromedarius]|uniref:Uncharacterized protein n=1 Tax=Camelus dromedarius TaxID=9838 RepID=A0A5N4CBG2_CAMDR|nr:hypothetical protein Cadr_000027719 [Camelus dromedarius]
MCLGLSPLRAGCSELIPARPQCADPNRAVPSVLTASYPSGALTSYNSVHGR